MMRSASSLLIKTTRLAIVRNVSAKAIRKGLTRSGAGTLMGQQAQQYRFAQQMNHMNKTSTLQSMREFFMHPLTWDRNNGYLNVVLALVIFSFCFINSCASCPEQGSQKQAKKQE